MHNAKHKKKFKALDTYILQLANKLNRMPKKAGR